MKLRSSSFLGVSVSDRAIAVAEVAVNGPRRVVRRVASFPFPTDASLEKAEAAGELFAAFLRQNGFSASRAVVGVPAKWLIALEKEIPPAEEEQARAMLRLQAERMSVTDNGEMVFDYTGELGSTAGPNKVLLVGVLRQRLEQLERLFDSAGVTVTAVTSSALALARGARNADQNQPMLLLGRAGAEVVWRHEGTAKMLRHVSVMAVNGHGPVSVGPVGSELGRSMTLGRANGVPTRELLLWDGIGLTAEQLTELAERSGLQVRPSAALEVLGLEAEPEAKMAADREAFAPALSLAVAGADRRLLPLDFRKSRLTPPPTRRLSRGTTYAILAGAVLLVGLVALYVYTERQQSRLDELQAEAKKLEPSVKSAQAMIERVNYGRSFFESRPPYLEVMRELTPMFPRYDPVYITNLTLRDNRKGQIQGKAPRDKMARDLLDQIKRNPKFGDVKLVTLRMSEGKTADWTFTISFTYVAKE